MALGVEYLPILLEKMSKRELLDFYTWQMRMYLIEMDGLLEMEEDFRALGFSPIEVMKLGQIKQLHASRMVMERMNVHLPLETLFNRVVEFRMQLDYPPEGGHVRRRVRWPRAMKALVYGTEREREVRDRVTEVAKAGTYAVHGGAPVA